MTETIVQSQYKRCDSEAVGKYVLKTAKRKNYKVYAALATIIVALSIILLQIPPFNLTSDYMSTIAGVLALIVLDIFVACAPAITKKGSVAANRRLEGSYMLHAFMTIIIFRAVKVHLENAKNPSDTRLLTRRLKQTNISCCF